MTDPHGSGRRLDLAIVDDCWNRIGVRGDRSCPELETHRHCRNCPVYAAGATTMLDAAPPAGYVDEWTAHVARPKAAAEADARRSLVVFRIGAEWLALPTSAVTEVANLLPVHSLPHRRGGAVLGLANIRGELLICVSLGDVIGVERSAETRHDRRNAIYRRLLVINRDEVRAVCPVDEVLGIHQVRPRDLKDVPSTVAHASSTYSTTLWSLDGRSVGVLDDQLVFYSLKRSLG